MMSWLAIRNGDPEVKSSIPVLDKHFVMGMVITSVSELFFLYNSIYIYLSIFICTLVTIIQAMLNLGYDGFYHFSL